ncbi:hypothetical protein F7725_011788 [Dissostichus mawsoni]|uniref:Major facilitator superfamily (MFS) profile domain-containing protein n=1 Tax=Dissostichus mawsoni TaxID=36200 RepID=A0A7J5ZCZ8_DISMA|nr:hypothetical protein F7725_011788 [Dissostichus mawsoni]
MNNALANKATTEWIGASKRSWGACVAQLFAAMGQCALAGVIYAIRHWRLAQLITAAQFAVVVIYIWFIPESARWLLSRGRTEEAKQLIIKAAAINKRTVSDSLLDKVLKIKNRGCYSNAIIFIFSLNLTIYSLYLNMGNIGFNVFLTQLMFGAFEVAANILSMWLMEVFGRRISLVSTFVTGGLSSIQTATALGAMSARAGGMMAPLLNMLVVFHWSIPAAVFSSFTMVAGALGFLLPETRNKELPESADEVENKRFGRKRATQISAVMLLIFVGASALCPNVYLYLVCQFFIGVGNGGYRVNCTVLCMYSLLTTEWIGASKRSWGACVSQLFAAMGQCVLAGVIYAIRHWRLAQLITAAQFAVVVIYIWFIPESARWLLSRGRTEEAKQLIIKAAAINKRTVSDSLLEKVLKIKDFSLNLTLFSLYLNMGNIGFNVFLTQLMFGAFEMAANILSMWLMEVFGRRISLVSTFVIGGISSMFILAVPQGYAIAVTSLAVASRFFLIWAGAVCTVYLQELFPTSVRQTATALGAMSARAGGMMAPLLNMLVVFHWSIPAAVFSSFTMVAGALGFLLPETRNKELPESADEVENKR